MSLVLFTCAQTSVQATAYAGTVRESALEDDSGREKISDILYNIDVITSVVKLIVHSP